MSFGSQQPSAQRKLPDFIIIYIYIIKFIKMGCGGPHHLPLKAVKYPALPKSSAIVAQFEPSAFVAHQLDDMA